MIHCYAHSKQNIKSPKFVAGKYLKRKNDFRSDQEAISQNSLSSRMSPLNTNVLQTANVSYIEYTDEHVSLIIFKVI